MVAEKSKVCLVAGVDFAHVGPRFGDSVELDQRLTDWMVSEDEKSLTFVTQGDAEGFWQSVMADGNRRHVCGLSATYTLLRLLDNTPGRILKYGYAPDPAGGIVSFAGVEF
jgi:predicted class III extradiol MEMO1 family dioxygenase